jgi:hypothetical protein
MRQIDFVPDFWSEFRGASILIILSFQQPTAIIGLIITERIYAVQNMALWTQSHVSDEALEGQPANTNGNPA